VGPQVDVKEEGLIDLPVEEKELDNLTEYNTAVNKRVLVIQEPPKLFKRKRKSVVFAEREEVINPEDVDASVGRFRNLISVQIIPNKRARSTGLAPVNTPVKKHVQDFYNKGLYGDMESHGNMATKTSGIAMQDNKNATAINLCPDVNDEPIMFESPTEIIQPEPSKQIEDFSLDEKKKIYHKEAWPGKKQEVHQSYLM